MACLQARRPHRGGPRRSRCRRRPRRPRPPPCDARWLRAGSRGRPRRRARCGRSPARPCPGRPRTRGRARRARARCSRTVPVNVAMAPASGPATCAISRSRSIGSGPSSTSGSDWPPPETGGISAISSPSFSAAERSAYSWLTAYARPGGSAPISSAAKTSPAIAPCGNSSSRRPDPARSRSAANSRTVTRTRDSLDDGELAGADGLAAHDQHRAPASRSCP